MNWNADIPQIYARRIRSEDKKDFGSSQKETIPLNEQTANGLKHVELWNYTFKPGYVKTEQNWTLKMTKDKRKIKKVSILSKL